MFIKVKGKVVPVL